MNLLSAHPVLIHKDQVNYRIHGKPIDQYMFEKFDSLFIDYYTRTVDEMGVKKNYPLTVNLYSDVKAFQADTGLPSFTAAIYESRRGEFYFLLNAKTIKEERLIILISHESCHAAFHSSENNISVRVSLEEGFCFYFYPSEFNLMANSISYCKLGLEKFLLEADKNLYKGNRSKKEEVYLISSQFIQYLFKNKNKEEIIYILRDKNYLQKLEEPWKQFCNNCQKRVN